MLCFSHEDGAEVGARGLFHKLGFGGDELRNVRCGYR